MAWFCVLVWTNAVADTSELAVGANTIQKLIATQLFDRQGPWYFLDNGPCYVYLESPQIRLRDGRVLLDAHLS